MRSLYTLYTYTKNTVHNRLAQILCVHLPTKEQKPYRFYLLIRGIFLNYYT